MSNSKYSEVEQPVAAVETAAPVVVEHDATGEAEWNAMLDAIDKYAALMNRLSGGTASEWRMREVVQEFMEAVVDYLSTWVDG